MTQTKGKFMLGFVLVTSMFFMWGLANNMTDTLLAAFKKIMSMSDFQTSWIQIAFYGSYFCLAIPAAMLIKKYFYKTGILVGLGMFIVGALLFYPASQTMVYGHFLTALFILAGGLSILETTANPYVLAMGDEASSIKRLNLAQSFNPIGSISGVVLSKYVILDNLNTADATIRASMSEAELMAMKNEELSAVMGAYVGVAFLLLVIWLVIKFADMPKVKEGHEIHLFASFSHLFKMPNYRFGVIAQFFYVGAQIGVWSFTIRYVMQELGMNESEAANVYLTSLMVFTVARFLFTGLLNRFGAAQLMIASSLIAVVCTATVVLTGGMIGVVALVLISGCMSLMFPTIFGMALIGTGEHQKIAGSGLIMAILGGAVLTAIQGQVSDSFGSINVSYIVPLACFLVVAYYGFSQKVKVKLTAEKGENL